MNREQWIKTVKGMKVGKRLPTALYVHASVQLPEEIEKVLAGVSREHRVMLGDYTVLKLSTDKMEISFLNYPDFFDTDHPALKWSLKVDVEKNTGKVTDYSHRDNPPILHRKECFLEPDHPAVAEFKAMTAWEESQGWYENTRIIGTLKGWEKVTGGRAYQRGTK